MLFNSYEFIYLFFPMVLFLYWATIKKGYFFSRLILCFSSIVFYSFMAIKYMPLMIVSILANYKIGMYVDRTKNRHWIFLGVIFNLSLIFFYKYFDLVFHNTFHITDELVNTIIPLGISFYTFTQIAYLVDSYHHRIAADRSFTSYFLFVTYFPHLIAGPILHHGEMISQFDDKNRYNINDKNIFQGLCFFIIGLSKKVLIADNLIPYVTPVFEAVSDGEMVYPLECWCGALAYTFQLYFDFSGYSDMAVGISKFFNFDLPFNFNSPYKAKSIADFWRKWHISLSSFLKDYLYIPLGGNQKGKERRYINLFLTMVLGGVWHGANWTFILWGAYHGILLVFTHMIPDSNQRKSILNFIKLPVTFLLIVIGWVMFRSENISAAVKYYAYMMDFKNYLVLPDGWGWLNTKFSLAVPIQEMPYFFGKNEILFLTLLGVACFYFPSSQKIVSQSLLLKKNWQLFLLFSFMMILFIKSLYNIDRVSEFIYFQF
jgi:alginate O-acetyltransferase complex protein AlgI